MTAPKRVRVVDRAASILACFGPADRALGLAEIAARAGIPKPTAFRILTTLTRHGLVEQDAAAGTYTLGFAVLRLSHVLLAGTEICRRARPFMARVRDAVNETVVLSLRDGDHRINIDSAGSTQAIAHTLQLGVRAPLYAGAASHIFLAAMSEDELDSYLARTPLVAFSPATPVTPDNIRARVAEVRAQGYALSFGEFTATVPPGSAIAVPVRDAGGRTVAALHVSGPKGRLTPELRDACLRELGAAARAIGEAPPST